jgi:hypothetical protein
LVTVGYSREQRREDAVHEDGVNPTLTLVRGLPIMETVSVDRSVVDEVNRYQVYFADDEIVSWKPETRRSGSKNASRLRMPAKTQRREKRVERTSSLDMSGS